MANNQLMRLDTRTGAIANWPLTQNQNGIMNVALDKRGNVWFAEQSGNYIGRFQQRNQQLQRFQLPTTQGQGLSPQDLFFDAQGMLWFTAVGSGQLGQLDPTTGKVRLWSLPQVDGAQLYPYSMTIDSQGQIWLGMLVGGVIARFDPSTAQFSVSRLADPQAEVPAFAPEQHSQIWFVELQTGKIGKIDVKAQHVTEYQVPSGTQQTDTAPTFSGIAVSAQGEVWIACPNGHTVIRYIPQTNTFTAIKLSISQSQPYHLTFDAHNHVWLTSSGEAASSYIGEIDPTQVHAVK
jgi:virginiamycin B lyase